MTKDFKVNIKKLKAGSKSEFEKVYFEFYDVLFSLAKQYLMNSVEAEGIVQNTFLKLWEVKSQLNENSNIKNYLFTVTKNNSLNQIRNNQNAQKLVQNFHYLEMKYNYEALNKLVDDYVQYQELKKKVDKSISDLPDDLRIVFEMNRKQDLTYKEIAAKLDVSEKTVEARMSKVLKNLRVELKEYLPIVLLFSEFLV